MASRLLQHSWRSTRSAGARLFSASTNLSTHPTPTDERNAHTIRHNHPTLTTSYDRRHPILTNLSSAPSNLFKHRIVHDGSILRNFSTSSSTQRSLKLDQKPDRPIPSDSYVMNLTVRDSNISKPSPSDRPTAPAAVDDAAKTEENMAEMGLFKRFKAMYKQYWYVMLPVHVITSTGWMAGFYYMSQSGVDVPELLRAISVSESIVSKIQNSPTGHLAIAYLCYKVATPIRYMVTIGGTTVSIKYLSQWGYIKPMPTAARMRELYDENADKMKRGYEDLQDKAKNAMQRGDKKDP